MEKLTNDFLDDIVNQDEVDDPQYDFQTPAVLKTMSIVDLNKYSSYIFGLEFEKLDNNNKDKLLWEIGFNVKQCGEKLSDNTCYKVVYVTDLHRTGYNKEHYGLRAIGSERVDSEWLRSGVASNAAKLYSDDSELRKDIKLMSKQ